MKNEFNLLFCVFRSIFLESRANEVQQDVTIEDEIRPVNLLCSNKVTYPTDHRYA